MSYFWPINMLLRYPLRHVWAFFSQFLFILHLFRASYHSFLLINIRPTRGLFTKTLPWKVQLLSEVPSIWEGLLPNIDFYFLVLSHIPTGFLHLKCCISELFCIALDYSGCWTSLVFQFQLSNIICFKQWHSVRFLHCISPIPWLLSWIIGSFLFNSRGSPCFVCPVD